MEVKTTLQIYKEHNTEIPFEYMNEHSSVLKNALRIHAHKKWIYLNDLIKYLEAENNINLENLNSIIELLKSYEARG